jgi:flagellar biosynthetic protein FliR
MDLFLLLTQRFESFLLVFLRLGGIFFISPFFGHESIPVKIKLMLTLIMAVIILPMIPAPEIKSSSLIELGIMVAQEISFGAIIGFASLLIFYAIQIAGQIIGFQMGFSMVNVIDPATSTSISVISQFKYIIAFLIYLMINGHHFLISAIFQSFKIIPPGSAVILPENGEFIIRISVEVLEIAIKVAAPAMVTLFLTSVMLGIIARTVPQMNVFIVGFPLKIAAGLLILAAGITYFGDIFIKFLSANEMNISKLIMISAGS